VLGFVPLRERSGFVLNSRSFRTREYVRPKPEGTVRIVTFGDSFNFACGGVPHRLMWSTQLEGILDQGGEGVEVIAMGVPGVGPRFELRLWELERDLLDADVVVVAFFVGNDLTDEHVLGRALRASEGLARVSYAFRLGRNLLRLRGASPGLPGKVTPLPHDPVFPTGGYEVAEPEDQRLVLSDDELERIEGLRVEPFLTRSERLLDTLIEDSRSTLVRFRDSVEAAGGSFVVMMIPDLAQVDADLRLRVLHRLGLEEDDLDPGRPQRRLARALGEAGIDHLDLLPHFVAESRHRDLYWSSDTHWNPAGNLLAARLLADYLLKKAALEAGQRTHSTDVPY
jgi:hypothetical protein